ncbi:hypothetical protein Y032_0145g2497 [Ancylostoma ceylanicum]|uniref:Uncharacterized protein n=1 Tax=Ancylostoma ceylanicum TaxID=53326 RepID=A0A016T2U7_9BILA|nr:hypothetical protein Y032_0145g2497 [Ancylostoma ceylanicum]
MPLFRGVVNLFNPFSWFASRADCKEDFVHREVEVQEEDLPEHWEIAPETCDEKLSCKDEVEHDDLENAVDGNTSLERTSDTAEFLDCSDGNDECSALEECCPSVGLVESVEGSSSKKEITCHLDASRSDDTQVDQLRSAIFAEDRSQELESLSVEEWNEQGTTNGSRIASDHMVSATELTPFVDSSMKKKGTVDVDKNLHKPNPAASTTEIPKTKKGKDSAEYPDFFKAWQHASSLILIPVPDAD